MNEVNKIRKYFINEIHKGESVFKEDVNRLSDRTIVTELIDSHRHIRNKMIALSTFKQKINEQKRITKKWLWENLP